MTKEGHKTLTNGYSKVMPWDQGSSHFISTLTNEGIT